MRKFFKIYIVIPLVLIFFTLTIVGFNLLFNSPKEIIVSEELIINDDLGSNLINTDIDLPETTTEELEEENFFVPPEIIRAVYSTSWSASNKNFIDYLVDLASTTEINFFPMGLKIAFVEIKKLFTSSLYLLIFS